MHLMKERRIASFMLGQKVLVLLLGRPKAGALLLLKPQIITDSLYVIH
jgi:hypothetical protein